MVRSDTSSREVTSQAYSMHDLSIHFLCIGLDVAEGQSPFDVGAKYGLLAILVLL